MFTFWPIIYSVVTTEPHFVKKGLNNHQRDCCLSLMENEVEHIIKSPQNSLSLTKRGRVHVSDMDHNSFI